MTLLNTIELDLDDPRWRTYATQNHASTIFHRPEWARVLAESYGFRAFALGFHEGSRLVGLLPVVEVGGRLQRRRWVSLPFTDVAPPLVDEELDQARFVNAIESARAAAGVELEVHAPIPGVAQVARGVEHVLALPDDVSVLQTRFKKQTWQQVRQADRNGLVPRVATARRDLLETYYRLHVATRRRQGVPTQPRRFFERLWENVLEPGNGFLVFAERGGHAAGGAVFLTGSRTLMYKYSASSPSLWQLRPNHLVLWTAMQEAIARGCTEMHFGRSDAETPGLSAFKRSWGSEERPLLYSQFGEGRGPGGASTGGRLGRILATTIRHSPPIVCRALGRALYRFAA